MINLTQINKLPFTGSDEVVSAEEKFNALTHEEIWKDYIPEPYVDQYHMLNDDPQSYSFPEIKNAVGNIFQTTQLDKGTNFVSFNSYRYFSTPLLFICKKFFQ